MRLNSLCLSWFLKSPTILHILQLRGMAGGHTWRTLSCGVAPLIHMWPGIPNQTPLLLPKENSNRKWQNGIIPLPVHTAWISKEACPFLDSTSSSCSSSFLTGSPWPLAWLLTLCHCPLPPHVNHTELYNEGGVFRLIGSPNPDFSSSICCTASGTYGMLQFFLYTIL